MTSSATRLAKLYLQKTAAPRARNPAMMLVTKLYSHGKKNLADHLAAQLGGEWTVQGPFSENYSDSVRYRFDSVVGHNLINLIIDPNYDDHRYRVTISAKQGSSRDFHKRFIVEFNDLKDVRKVFPNDFLSSLRDAFGGSYSVEVNMIKDFSLTLESEMRDLVTKVKQVLTESSSLRETTSPTEIVNIMRKVVRDAERSADQVSGSLSGMSAAIGRLNR